MGKLTKEMKFEDILKNRVDMERVDLESIKPWISNRITDLIKQEDEVLIDYIYNQLDIKFPDPKEIQTNLSGFLSFTNARIFTGELWKELINAMGSNGSTKNGSQRITNDKVKSFPRLGPTENKPINNENINRKKSFEKRDERHYRSTGSRSESVSSRFNSRIRSMSSNNYKYRFDGRHRNKIRSRTKSSSRYTPYTRYSQYTESCESSSNSGSSVSNYNMRRSYSTCSSSSSCQAYIRSNLHCDNKTKGDVQSRNSNSMSPVIVNSNKYDGEITKEFCHSDSTESIEMAPKNISPLQNAKCTSPKCYSSNGSSCSVSFVSPQNNQSRQMSQSLYSSSSEYSIEYREKTFFTNPQQCIDEEDDFNSDIESESEVEWVTAKTLRELHESGHIRYEEHCFYFEQSSDHLRSPTDSESISCTNSETSISDIEWVEQDQFRQLSNDYFRV